MLLDNKKITLIKYRGTQTFVAGLFREKGEKNEKYFFGFTPTKEPLFLLMTMKKNFGLQQEFL